MKAMVQTVAVPLSQWLPSLSQTLHRSRSGPAASEVPCCQSWLEEREEQPLEVLPG